MAGATFLKFGYFLQDIYKIKFCLNEFSFRMSPYFFMIFTLLSAAFLPTFNFFTNFSNLIKEEILHHVLLGCCRNSISRMSNFIH